MADRAQVFHEAGAHYRLSALAGDPKPALLFDRTGTGLVWVNGAGAAYLGIRSLDALAARGFAPDGVGARRVAALARQLAAGEERTERIALPKGLLPQPVVCRASRVIVRGERCVLLTAVDGTGRLSEAEAAARYLAIAGAEPPPADATAAPVATAATPVTADATETEIDPYTAASPNGADGTMDSVLALADALDGDGIRVEATPEDAPSAWVEAGAEALSSVEPTPEVGGDLGGDESAVDTTVVDEPAAGEEPETQSGTAEDVVPAEADGAAIPATAPDLDIDAVPQPDTMASEDRERKRRSPRRSRPRRSRDRRLPPNRNAPASSRRPMAGWSALSSNSMPASPSPS